MTVVTRNTRSVNVPVECSNSPRYYSVIRGVISQKTRIFVNIDVRTSDLEKESNPLFINYFLYHIVWTDERNSNLPNTTFLWLRYLRFHAAPFGETKNDSEVSTSNKFWQRTLAPTVLKHPCTVSYRNDVCNNYIHTKDWIMKRTYWKFTHISLHERLLWASLPLKEAFFLSKPSNSM